MIYLIPAYAFAVLVLGGYLAWSLRRLRELSRTEEAAKALPHRQGGEPGAGSARPGALRGDVPP